MRRPRTRILVLTALLLIALPLARDFRRAPGDQFIVRAAVAAIHLYQGSLSPLYARMGVKCRFTPSCSHYGETVIEQFGVLRGGWLAIKRVVRCGPWTPMGTMDAPPGLKT